MRTSGIAAFLVFVTLALAAGPARAADPAAAGAASPKLELIISLIKASGVGKAIDVTMQQNVRRMLPLIKQAHPTVPPAVFDEFAQRFIEEVHRSRVEVYKRIAEIWDRHFTRDEIRDILAFYNSPSGRKLVLVQPQIIVESTRAGSEWGRVLAQRVYDDMKDQFESP